MSGGIKTFSASKIPPDIKVIILVADTDLVNSKLLTTKITIKETNSNDIYLKNFVKLVDKKKIEVNTTSKECVNASLNSHYHVYNNYKKKSWKSKEIFCVDCEIIFEHRGPLDEVSNQVEQLLASGKVSKLQLMASMINDRTFADFTFNVRGREFKVHRNILAAASDVMKTMFICGPDETEYNSATIDCDPEIFAHLINFVYANDIPVAEMPKICVELHELAHRYGIVLLGKICLVYMKKVTIDADSALKLYEIAVTQKITELRTTSWEFIKT